MPNLSATWVCGIPLHRWRRYISNISKDGSSVFWEVDIIRSRDSVGRFARTGRSARLQPDRNCTSIAFQPLQSSRTFTATFPRWQLLPMANCVLMRFLTRSPPHMPLSATTSAVLHSWRRYLEPGGCSSVSITSNGNAILPCLSCGVQNDRRVVAQSSL